MSYNWEKNLVKSDVLTTKELAGYLKLNEKTVLKMAQAGEVPGVKIGNQWRFFLSAIDEYLQDKIIKSSGYDFGMAIKTPDIMPLSRLVDHSTINLDLKSIHKGSIIYELAEIAQGAGVVVSIERLLIQLKKREDMLSTAIGNGVAIPHPRNPSDDLFKKPSVIIARSIKGVNFSAPDRKKVNLFFMTCAPDVVLHLKLLSKIAKLLGGENIFQKFMTVDSKEGVMKILLRAERISTKRPLKYSAL